MSWTARSASSSSVESWTRSPIPAGRGGRRRSSTTRRSTSRRVSAARSTPTFSAGALRLDRSEESPRARTDPPLVLVCLATVSRGAALVARTGVLTVNVLGADQEHVSRRFADLRREPGAGAFAGLAVAEGRTGCPVLLGAVAHLDCRVSAVHVGGDHVIVVAEVVHLAGDPTRRPLVHQGGRYRYLAEPGVPDLQRAM